MQKFFFLLLIVLSTFISACSKHADAEAFLITGKVEGAENVRLVLESFSFPNINGTPKTTVIDTARTDEEGNFEIKNFVPQRTICRLKIAGKEDFYILLSIQNEQITISASTSSGEMPVISGSSSTSILYSFIAMLRNKNMEIMETQAALAQYQQVNEDSLVQIQKQILTEQINAYYLSITTFADTTKEFSNAAIALESLLFNEYYNEIKTIYEKRKNTIDSSSFYAKELGQKIIKYEAIAADVASKSFVGKKAIDIALPNPSNVIMKLSDLKGKYVLLDFWASWCGPCRKENPNLVATYQKYKDKGFTIYSVSLDDDKEAWENAIDKDELIWPYHVSELKQMNSAIANVYNITGIPMNFLIDINGNIIAENLRGENLELKLEEIIP